METREGKSWKSGIACDASDVIEDPIKLYSMRNYDLNYLLQG